MPVEIYILGPATTKETRVLIVFTRKILHLKKLPLFTSAPWLLIKKPFPLSTGINILEKLSLRYNQNTISIETGIIDYHANGKGHIRYKLQKDGKDEAWQYGACLLHDTI